MMELEELQLKHREEAARKRAKLKERKARAHRLIERGAILEAALKDIVDPACLSNEEVQKIVWFAEKLDFLFTAVQNGIYMMMFRWDVTAAGKGGGHD